jgi:hypothetical protein
METVTIPITTGAYKNTDSTMLDEDSLSLYDCYLDEKEATNKRPGLASFVDTGSAFPIDAVYWWSAKKMLIVVTRGLIFKINYPPAVPVNITGTQLQQNARVSFATDGNYLFMANGGAILYTDGTTLTTPISDLDAPTSTTHIAYIDGYLIANNGTNNFQYSDANNAFSWQALSTARAAGDPDIISALRILNREIYLFGSQSIEVWENKGALPFARIPGGFIQSGTAAPYSIVVVENGMFWLNNFRRFVQYSGKGVEEISTPYDREIQNFQFVSDCFGERIDISGQSFLAFHFPSANKTLVLNRNTNPNSWSEWCFWDGEAGQYNRWLANSYCYAEDWGLNLVGSRTTGKVYRISSSLYDDDGSPIRAARITGNISYNTLKNKRSEEIRIRAKRGAVSTSTTPQIMFRWRDDNKNSWSSEKWLSLGNLGETDLILKLRRNGVFRTRQYEIASTDSVPFIISQAEEDVTILTR